MGWREVTDPKVLAQLESGQYRPAEEQAISQQLIPKNFNPFSMSPQERKPTLQNFNKEVSDPIINFVESARLPSLAGGFLQGASDIGISAANLIPELMGKEKIQHLDLKKYLPQDILSDASFLGGELAGGGGAFGKLYGGINKALPNLPGAARLLSNTGKSGLAGYVSGEEAPFGRGGGAVLGSAGQFAHSLLPSSISNRIVTAMQKAQSKYRELYNRLFNTANQAGIASVNIPQINARYLMEHVPGSYTDSLKEFFNNPTVENAHWAQSDLGKYVAKLKGKADLTSSQIKAVKLAKEAHNDITKEISSALNAQPQLNLAENYKNLNFGYKKDVIPYTSNPHINKFLNGKLTNKGLVDRLGKAEEGEAFRKQLGHNFPELRVRNMLTSPTAKWIAGGTAFGLGLKPALDLYKNTNL